MRHPIPALPACLLFAIAPVLALGVAACGSSRAAIDPVMLRGQTWAFDAVVGEPIAGTMTFDREGRVEVRCRGEPEREWVVAERSTRTELRIPACDALLLVRRRDDGTLYALVERVIRRVEGMTERCVRWITTDDGEEICAQSEYGDRVTSRTQRMEIDLERVVGGR